MDAEINEVRDIGMLYLNLLNEKQYDVYDEYVSFVKTNFNKIKKDMEMRRKIYDHYIANKNQNYWNKISNFLFDKFSSTYNKDKIVAELRDLLAKHNALPPYESILNIDIIYSKILNNIPFIHEHNNLTYTCYKQAKIIITQIDNQKVHDSYTENATNTLVEYINFVEQYYPERITNI